MYEKKTKSIFINFLFFFFSKVGANWKNHSYHIKVSVPKHEFSLDNKTLELELPPATLSYSINEQKEEITTDPVSISVELKDFVLIQGGWFM